MTNRKRLPPVENSCTWYPFGSGCWRNRKRHRNYYVNPAEIEELATHDYISFNLRIIHAKFLVNNIKEFQSRWRTGLRFQIPNIFQHVFEWREIRNKVVHDNQKIYPEIAQKAKAYFDSAIPKLKKLLKNLPCGGKLTMDLGDFEVRKTG